MKYYFYTIAGKRNSVPFSLDYWTYVRDIHPLDMLFDIEKSEQSSSRPYYSEFYVIHSMEINEEKYEKYKDKYE